jgi:hypothetical protein
MRLEQGRKGHLVTFEEVFLKKTIEHCDVKVARLL